MAGKKTQVLKVKQKFQHHDMNFSFIFFAHAYIEICHITANYNTDITDSKVWLNVFTAHIAINEI